MTWNWQDITALSIVGLAFAYVASLVFHRLRQRQRDGCGGGCFGCKQADAEPTTVVTAIGKAKTLRHS